jgi:glycosyltransferase 2 family protein
VKSLGLTLLKIALAVLLALYVVNQVELGDRLLGPKPEDDGARIEIRGDLQGDLQANTWVFKVDADATAPTALPQATPGHIFQPADLKPYFEQEWELLPGFLTILTGLKVPWLLMGAALWGVLLILASVRWRILLRAAGIETSLVNALRLCFIGYFFNNVMPGVTGGDVVRGALITRGLDSQRWRAALSVIVDRLIGLVALLSLAACVLAWSLLEAGEESAYPAVLTRGVFVFLGAAVLGGGAYLSRRVREFLGIEKWLGKLPGGTTLAKIDGGLSVYRESPRGLAAAFLMSLPLQICGVLSFWAIGHALSAPISLADDFVIFPVVQTISAIPVAPAGWGLGETLYGKSFALFGSTFTLGVAVSILFRLTTQLGFGLIGGIVWVSSSQRKEEVQLIQSEK